jgi:hypothetical protein
MLSADDEEHEPIATPASVKLWRRTSKVQDAVEVLHIASSGGVHR